MEDKKFKIDNLNFEDCSLLSLNILPNCETILHKCFSNYRIIEHLYQTVKDSSFSIPFIFNLNK
jgi:hypothetical protein